MSYTIYVDVIFLWSAVINFVVLCAAAWISNHRTAILKTIIGSAITAAVTTALYVFIPFYTLLFKIIYAFLHISMLSLFLKHTYGLCIFTGIKQLLLCSVILSGIYTAMRIGEYHLAIGIALVLIGILPLLLLFKIHKGISQSIYDLSITFQGRKIYFRGFLDTGNSLIDPYTGNGVVVIDYKTFGKIFDNRSISEHYHHTGSFDYTMAVKLFKTAFYPINYRTISDKSYSSMPAFHISELEYTDTGKKYNHITVAVSKNRINEDGYYQLLISRRLVP